jgi:hypothetical protein
MHEFAERGTKVSQTVDVGGISEASYKLLEAIEGDPAAYSAFVADPVGTLASYGATMPTMTADIEAAYESYLSSVAATMGGAANS